MSKRSCVKVVVVEADRRHFEFSYVAGDDRSSQAVKEDRKENTTNTDANEKENEEK